MAAIAAGLVTLLPAASRGALITASASVQQTGPVFGNDSAGATSNGATPLIDTATFGLNTASFSLTPSQNAGVVTGASAPIEFSQWNFLHYESTTQAYVQMAGTFEITSPLPTPAPFTIDFDWAGALRPNIAFENEYAEAGLGSTITARANFDLSFGTPGHLTGHASNQITGNRGRDVFSETELAFLTATDSSREFAFSVTIGGVGMRGGGFNLAGETSSLTALARAAQDDGFLDTSFFEIVLNLPPGMTYTSDVPYLRAVTVPEPGSAALIGVALAIAAGVRRTGLEQPQIESARSRRTSRRTAARE